MNEETERVVVTRDPWWNKVEFRFGVLRGGQWAIAKPVTMEDIGPGYTSAPTLTMSGSSAQLLMDELWNVGIRPTEGTGSAGSLAATERHLADMRRIALESLEAQGVLRAPEVIYGDGTAGLTD